MNIQTTDTSINSNSELKYVGMKNKIINQYAYFDLINSNTINQGISQSNKDLPKYTENTDSSFNNSNQRNEILNRDTENFPNLPINIKYPNLSSNYSVKNTNSNTSKKPLITSPKSNGRLKSLDFNSNNLNEKLQFISQTDKKPEISNHHINRALLNSSSKILSEENKQILSIPSEKPLTPLKVKYAMSDIFDKKLGMKLNMVNSPHKQKIDSFKVNMNDLQRFCMGDNLYKDETEEEKKYRKEELEKKQHNDFLLHDMKKKVFFMKNIIDYVYPKVIVSKVNSQVEAVKIKNKKKSKSKSLGNIKLKIPRKSFDFNNTNNNNLNANNAYENNNNKFNLEEKLKKYSNNYNYNLLNGNTDINDISQNDNNKPEFIKNLISKAKKLNQNITIAENISILSTSKNLKTLDPNDYYTMQTAESKHMEKMEKMNKLKKKSNNLQKKFQNFNTIGDENSEKTNSIFHPEFTSLINRNIARSPSYKISDLDINNSYNNIQLNSNSKLDNGIQKTVSNAALENSKNNISNLNNILFSVNSSKENEEFEKRRKKESKKLDFVTELLTFNSKVTDLNDAIRRETEGTEKRINFDTNSDEGRFNLMSMNTEDTAGRLISPQGSARKRKMCKVINPIGIINYQNYELNPK